MILLETKTPLYKTCLP